MLLQNFRYSLRQLAKNPGFAIVAIGTLALGIGMTAAMFTVVYAVLLRPLSFPKSEQVVVIGQATQTDSHPGPSALPNIRDWREQSQSFQDIAYWNLSVHNLTDQQKAEMVVDVQCSANLFSLLRTQPVLGRTFDAKEEQPGNGNVAVLSAKVWKGFFSSDPNILGSRIELGTNQYTVIGVMPDDCIFPLTQSGSLIWLPIQARKEWEDRNTAMLQVAGRLKDGVTLTAAQQELTSITNHEAGADKTDRVLLEDYRESITGNARPALMSLEAAVLAVWLIACINLVSLMLARATARRRETAIRCALGANRRKLLGQFFAESATLGGIAGLLGLLLCFGFLQVLRFYLQYKLPFADSIQVNLPVVGVILGLSLASTLLVGLWPALQAFWTSPQEALRDGAPASGTSRRQRRVQDLLVIGEVALSLVLLLNAGLLLRTLYNLRSTPLGFTPSHLIIAQVPLFQGNNAGNDVMATMYDPLLRQLGQLPGVESVATSTTMPMSPGSSSKMPVQILGSQNPSKKAATAELRIVSPELHRTLGIRLVSGRYFMESDSRSTPWVVVVNQAFVRKFFPDEDPIGHQVRTDESGPHMYSAIVGVVEDTHQQTIAEPVEPEIDLNYRQLTPDDGFASLLGAFLQIAVRTKGEPAAVIPSLRLALQQANPYVPANISTMQDTVDRSLGSQTLAARLIGIFAACALVIAIIGLYGLLAYNVSRSTRDIAVRLALGATRSKVLGMVVRHAALVMGIGIGIGFIVWTQTSHLLRSYLYGVGSHDLTTILAVALTLIAFGLLASYIPARRASLIDPMAALRHE